MENQKYEVGGSENKHESDFPMQPIQEALHKETAYNQEELEKVREKLNKTDDLKFSYRVPLTGEVPAQLVKEIDPSLDYIGANNGFDRSMSNYLYMVRDKNDGVKKVLKIGAASAYVGESVFGFFNNEPNTEKEHYILNLLNKAGIKGIPRLYKTYNSLIEKRDKAKLTAMLREYIEGEDVEEKPRDNDFYLKLYKLFCDIQNEGIILPMDVCNYGNIMVGPDNQPYCIDFEESVVFDKNKSNRDGNRYAAEKISENIRIGNIIQQMCKSKNLLIRFIGRWNYFEKILHYLEYKKPDYSRSYHQQ